MTLPYIISKSHNISSTEENIATNYVLQSCSQYFETFWWLGKFSLHRKWNEAWLLVINWYMQVASRGAEQLKVLVSKTWGLRKLGNIRKISKLHRTIA